MKKTTSSLSVLLGIMASLLILLQSCETDIDITAPYERIPVIYGLLDMQADTQFIMINRTFLGVGDVSDMAQVEDSTLYQDLQAYLRWEDNGQLQDSVELLPIVTNFKDTDGLFYAPEQTVYYAPTIDLDMGASEEILENRIYTLSAIGDGQRILASTSLVNNDNDLTRPGPFSSDVDFVLSFNEGGSTFRTNYEVSWKLDRNSVKYKLDIQFNYTEVLIDNTTRQKSIIVPVIQTNVPYPNVVGSIPTNSEFRPGNFFFTQVAAQIQPDPEVSRRRFDNLDYIITAAGVDFTTYLDVGDPVSSVGQERPRYSNINDGEGIGVFSSRGTFVRTIHLSDDGSTDGDMDELVRGSFTGDLCFCDARVGSEYDCSTLSGNEPCQ